MARVRRRTVRGMARRMAWICALLVTASFVRVAPRALAQESAPDTTVLPPPRSIYLPAVVTDERPLCPEVSSYSYASLPVQGTLRSGSYSAEIDPDINLAVRDYVTLPGRLSLVNIYGPTDEDAPQLAGIFRPWRVPAFSAVHRVYDWDWACPTAPAGAGCRGTLLESPDYTALSLVTVTGETIYPPARRPNILAGGYIALVLYAEERQVTLTYTREDTPARGYLIHLDNFCVDPNLLTLYRTLDQAGRASLPGVRADDPLGTALTAPLVVAVRDSGSFMDPRSAKDWWQEAAAQLRAAAVDP